MFISTQTAVTLIYKLISTEVEVVKATNSARGVSKRLEKQERDAITAVFRALTGGEPTAEQLAEINRF